MNSLTFDTYQFVTELKDAGFDEKQAKAVVNTIKKSHRDADVATKADLEIGLRELEQRLTTRFGVMLTAAVAMLAVLIKVL